MATKSDITSAADFFVGEDKTLSGVVYQSDESTPQDITGWTLSWMLKRYASQADVDAIITKTTSSGITMVDATAGTYSVAIADTDTDGLTPTTYRHELKRTDPGFETVLTYGSCLLRRGVHKS